MKKSKKPIHESIQALNIYEAAKAYFNELELYDIIDDAIVLESDNDETNAFATNCWSFRVDIKFCTKEDIKTFYQAVIDARRRYIENKKPSNKMRFYTYYDGMSGNFYLSLIPSNWKHLQEGKTMPFGCAVNIVESVDDIIQEFIDCPYNGVIPLSEFKILDPADYNDEDEDEVERIQNVWSIILP